MPASKTSESGIFRFQVGESAHGLRLSRMVSGEVPGLSVRAAKALVDRGRVFVERERVIRASRRVTEGERIEVHMDLSPLIPSLCREDIVWMQASLIVLNKPAGLVVYGTRGMTPDTVVPQLTRLLKDTGEDQRGERLMLVHRLDRDTSGLLLVARSEKPARFLERQFFKHQVKKRYKVLVQGVPDAERFQRVAAVTAKRPPGEPFAGPVDRGLPRGRGGKEKPEAVTDFRVLETYTNCALLEAQPSTGHTHQIRIHLAQLGHPVLGDMLYGAKTVKNPLFRSVPRQMLHAAYLELSDPDTGEPIRLHAPVPEDMRRLLAELESR